jgi:uncharacterized protein (TIGR03435 family)
MRSVILALACLTIARMCGVAQTTAAQSFIVASVKPASASDSAISCQGGPGSSDPGLWRCTSVPIGLLITEGYELDRYQFRANDPCCVARFNISARVPPGATKAQFHKMIRNLLEDRFQLKLHFEKEAMTTYDLTIAESGLKLKASSGNAPPGTGDPWASTKYGTGKDGYPVFSAGQGGLAGIGGRYRWVGFNVTAKDICRTLSFYVGGPVIDHTGLTGEYDVDLRWWIDIAWAMERAGYTEDLPDLGRSGPPLTRAVNDQLGLSLRARKGQGDIVIIDHIAKVPSGN